MDIEENIAGIVATLVHSKKEEIKFDKSEIHSREKKIEPESERQIAEAKEEAKRRIWRYIPQVIKENFFNPDYRTRSGIARCLNEYNKLVQQYGNDGRGDGNSNEFSEHTMQAIKTQAIKEVFASARCASEYATLQENQAKPNKPEIVKVVKESSLLENRIKILEGESAKNKAFNRLLIASHTHRNTTKKPGVFVDKNLMILPETRETEQTKHFIGLFGNMDYLHKLINGYAWLERFKQLGGAGIKQTAINSYSMIVNDLLPRKDGNLACFKNECRCEFDDNREFAGAFFSFEKRGENYALQKIERMYRNKTVNIALEIGNNRISRGTIETYLGRLLGIDLGQRLLEKAPISACSTTCRFNFDKIEDIEKEAIMYIADVVNFINANQIGKFKILLPRSFERYAPNCIYVPEKDSGKEPGFALKPAYN